MDIMVNMMLTYSWLKFTYTLLFTTCVSTCIQIPKIEIFGPAGSSPPAAYRCVLCTKVLCTIKCLSFWMLDYAV